MKSWQFVQFVLGLCTLVGGWSTAVAADRDLEAAIEKRLIRLKRTEAAHQELAAERTKVQTQLMGVAEQIAVATRQVAILNQQAATLSKDYVALQLRHVMLVQGNGPAGQIQLVRTQLNQTDVAVKQTNLASAQTAQRAKTLENQGTGVQRTLQGVLKQIDKQSLDYVELADVVGTLSRAEHEAALPEFNAWLKADESNWGARFARAVAYRKLAKIEEALADLTLTANSQTALAPLALAVRGDIQVASGKEREGIADLAQAYKQDKKSSYIYLLRGMANLRTEKYAAAEADFKFAIRADKKDLDTESLRLLALMHAACEVASVRHGPQALEFGKQAVELCKYEDWSCFDALAAAHAEVGEYDEAARTAKEAAELTFGENRELCLERAKLYEARMPLRITWK